ncbi:SDH family Clp fold serine proteinase [Ralstonia pseudosolanacearum]
MTGRQREPVDLLLETNGGITDATEKICALLRKSAPDLRVLVPRRAKSNGTVIALCGQSVVMSSTSELGPIDPSVGGVPVDFILKSPPGSINPIQTQIAVTALEQTKKLAKQLLSTGMMSDRLADIDATIGKLASRDHFHSHGSVMDCTEAAALGLKVEEMDSKSDLWKQIWLLRTMYSYDCGRNGHSKLFESSRISTAVTAAPQAGNQ